MFADPRDEANFNELRKIDNFRKVRQLNMSTDKVSRIITINYLIINFY